MSETRFVCFYSFKGGVGRSLTLINTAFSLARTGKKVLVIDLDLEAPGQHCSPLFKTISGQVRKQSGFVELLNRYKASIVNSEKTKTKRDKFLWNLDDYIFSSSVYSEFEQTKNKGTKPGSLWLMPAGAMDTNYLEILSSWDWHSFYNDHKGALFFEALKAVLRHEGFDYVLIDSRTGFNDVSYISTLTLAETIVFVSGFHDQHIEGMREFVHEIKAPETVAKYGNKEIIFVASPYPTGLGMRAVVDREIEIKREWDGFPQWHIALPYNPELALREEVLAYKNADIYDRTVQNDPYLLGIAALTDGIIDGFKLSSLPSSDEKIENPFKIIRSEHSEIRTLLQYYVSPGEQYTDAMELFTPAILFGARGTGKTMLARRYSFEGECALLKEQNQKPSPETLKWIGLYFRPDVDLLRMFDTRDEELKPIFDKQFEQFLDILFFRQAVDALEKSGGIENWCSNSEKFYKAILRELGNFEPADFSLETMKDEIENTLSKIRIFVNNPASNKAHFVFQSNILMKTLVEHLKTGGKFISHYFITMIDEYENFRPYQQKIVNTRLKQSKDADKITFKIFSRNGGLYTYDTKAKGQPIEPTNDYRTYNLDEGDGHNFDKFKTQMIKVANKHLFFNAYFRSQNWINIEELFENLNPAQEAELLFKGRRKNMLLEWLNDQHPNDKDKFAKWFKEEDNRLKHTVAVVLLNQGSKDSDEIISEFRENTQKAKDWYHNYHRGALRWLYRRYHQNKIFSGINDIVGVSGFNIRVFLDLCYAIIDSWLADNSNKHPIPYKLQSEAMLIQAQIYRDNLDTISKNGNKIKLVVDRLGELFETMQTSPKQSEPEINHFSIDGTLSDNAQKLLTECHQVSALRRNQGNKAKEISDYRRDNWQLNQRYSPLRGLSWRYIKKTKFTSEEIETIFFGTNEAFQKLLITHKNRASLSQKEDQNQQRLL